jgi:glutaminyl-tRNA synthetase
VEENLDLFARMRAGEFPDGAHVLRAKIDMASKSILMRDTLLYRIRHAHHHRTGDAWCIYPMYDYAHPLSDAIESITHSICTLEFADHREFYDWVVAEARELLPATPHQYEFARLNIDYTMMSKRNLLTLVEEKLVAGWDDPRMPTIAGIRRRGVTPQAIRDFADMVGVAKANSVVDLGKLEYCIRNDLNFTAPRRMCVLDPVKVVLTNYPVGQVEQLEAADFPPDVDRPGTHSLAFSRELYIERSDFEQTPPKGFYRLSPGAEVRLAFAYIIRCDEVVTQDGKVVELRCSYDPESKSGSVGRKVKGVIHWVSAQFGVPCEVRLYDRLFLAEAPGAERDFHEDLNPASLTVIAGAVVEPSVVADPAGSRYQFTRQGYFCSDAVDSTAEKLVFNRTVLLRDSWAKPVSAGAAVSAPLPSQPKAEASGDKRPSKKTAGQRRADARAEDPALLSRMEAYQNSLGLSEEEADLLTGDRQLSDYFDEACRAYAKAPILAKWVVNDLLREVKDQPASELRLRPASLASLARLVDEGAISSAAGKTVFAKLIAEGGEPQAWVERLGLAKVADDGALAACVEKVIAASPEQVKKYREGKKNLLGFFVGQVMKELGSADPAATRELLTKRLEG